MNRTLTLYTTDHCTLCDEAMTLLLDDPGVAPALAGMHLRTVDVALDDVLLERYGSQVPVLCADTRTLTWPFDAKAVLALIADVGEPTAKDHDAHRPS